MANAMDVPYVPAQRHFNDMDIYSRRASVVGGRVQVVPHGWEALDLLCMGKARAQ